jgi:signal transduction histidine kinase
MKISTRISLAIASTIFILVVLLNAIVYYAFINLTYTNETAIMTKTVNQLIREHAILKDGTLAQDKIASFLSKHAFFRVVTKQGTIKSSMSYDNQLFVEVPAKFHLHAQSEHFKFGEFDYILIRKPIQLGSTDQVVTLEFADRFSNLESRKDLIQVILISITLFATLIAYIASRSLTRYILAPIRTLILAMQETRNNGLSNKISVSTTQDEMGQLAMTYNNMIDRIQLSLDQQSQFVADASHELRSPLTVITSFTELLQKHGRNNAQLTNEAIEAIASETQRMTLLTESLLQLANEENNHGEAHSRINILRLIREVSQRFQAVYSRSIHLNLPTDNVYIAGVESKISQILIILIDNAIKYSTDQIHLSVNDFNDSIEIQIKDSGIGISTKDLPHIFERFYRVDKARSRLSGGSGLGLSIAKSIIENLNGSISVQSKENVGTTFYLRFPKQKPTSS